MIDHDIAKIKENENQKYIYKAMETSRINTYIGDIKKRALICSKSLCPIYCT